MPIDDVAAVPLRSDPLLPVAPPSPASGVRPLIVVVSGVDWDGVRGTERQLVEALRVSADVLWVDRPRSVVTPRRYLGAATGRSWRSRARRVLPGVVRLSPVVLPGHSRQAVRLATWPLVRHQIHAVLQRSGRRPVAVVACSFDDVLGHWGDDVLNVLYGTDDWVAGAALMGQPSARLEQDERRALRRADLALAVGPELADRWRALGTEAAVLPNGCDIDAFAAVERTVPAPVPDGFPHPVAGVMGRLTDRIDVGLLDAVVDQGVGLLLVGPPDPRWAAGPGAGLLARRGVHSVGAVPYDDLPRWLARMNVGLVPYTDSTFNRASFPLKTLEYLAAGLPVVAADLPAVRRLGALPDDLRLVRGGPAFADAVVDLAGQGLSRDAAARRRAVAAVHSWRERASTLVTLVDEHHPSWRKT